MAGRFARFLKPRAGTSIRIDPHLFSPAEVVLGSLETGAVFRFGHVAEEVLQRSFGI